MNNSVECEFCGEEFSGENSLQQHQEAKHPDEISSTDWYAIGKNMGIYALSGIVILGSIFIAIYWVIPWLNMKQLPKEGDHWHAPYSIAICGDKLPPRPYSQGDVHTHGKGQIHIHPHSTATEGKKANLEAFFESFNSTLTDTMIAIPMVGTYKNGDSCNGSPGRVSVYVNGSKISKPSSFVPSDGDNVQIKFEPQS